MDPPRIQVVRGDITRETTDAIVNAANPTLLGGGGVDGAIHRAAGPRLLEACRRLNGCPTGDARITPGFDLSARHVIHTVGPVWHGGTRGEDDLLASCYRNALSLARDHGLSSVSFPSISTGAYGFPLTRAARIAVAETRRFLDAHATPRHVRVVCFDEATHDAYEAALHQAETPRDVRP